ncbi:hypothetical protein Q1W73_08360 [Asticcacaulis sp. ZE23SCel15]|uniref:hypothetical protein n=1 Tax=Asticcacaulis sp. ZE23SCel15 TaxID=3059027 RepID=UPI00265FE498|nr:hypothetical protein [Asticcacaulis sp. ZE23SCel15]WKL58986.1 hypothetical protein Q1W73_08360 [Asticcacaulis sp. ZE23SCel15]
MIKRKTAIFAVIAAVLIGAGISLAMFYFSWHKATQGVVEIHNSDSGWRVSLDNSKGIGKAVYLYQDDGVVIAFDSNDGYFLGLTDAPDKALAVKVVKPDSGQLKPEIIDLARERVRNAVSKDIKIGLIPEESRYDK